MATHHALLFSDVVDSTQLTERLGDEKASALWVEHDRKARQLLAAHRGREIDRADGFLMLFERPADAATYAVGYQALMDALALRARVGIHVGAVTLRHNDAQAVALGAKPIEVEGLAKPLAARIMALARGRQTLLSAAARAAIDAVPHGFEIESHGHYRLKGIDDPVEVFELGALTAAFVPPADGDKSYRVTQAQGQWSPVREVRHNLAVEADAFVGRSQELRALARQLDAGVRVVTVVGTGGVGKTRIVRHYAHAWLGDWPGGVYFCDLSEARSLDGIHLAVSLALGVPLGTDDPAVQIGHAIAGRGTCLIVLDNFEQLVALARATVGRWSERAPHASFVVTSRERLQLPGEQLFELEPLRLHTDAIELFECRARQQQADFAVDAANRDHVAEVARLLDGLPLAIELAAARVRVLPPRQLIRRLQDRFGVLAGSRGAVPRHVTLKATIDWSWELLSPWEQAGLAQCSVFEGGFALEAAEAVLDLSSWPEAPSTLDVIQALLDKSLLRSWTTGSPSGPSEQRRFGMYLSIQEYAAGRLTQASDAASSLAALRHGQHFARLGTEPEIEALASREGVARRAALERDIDNLVVACRRALTRRDGEVAVRAYVACSLVLQWRGPYALCVALGAQVLGLPDLAPPLRIAALGARASVSGLVGLSQEAMSGLDEAASLAQATSDRKLLIDVLVHQGNLSLESGNAPVAIARYDAALAILRERPDRRREAWALGNRARAATLVGQVDAAHEAYSASIAIDRELGDRASEGVSLGNLSMALLNQGRFDAALPMLEQALAIHRDVGHRRHEVLVLNNIANVLMLQGRLEAAEERYRQALSIARDAGFRNDEGTLLGNLANFDELRGDLAKAREQHIAALTIERETGARQQQCVSHINLAMLDHALGTLGEAREHYERALAICRESGNPRLEGVALGGLAALLLDLGELAAARAAQQQASLFLRHVNDTFELARLTCVRGLIEAAEGDVEQARRTLLEAQAAADEVGAGPRSEVGRAIERLRAVVG